MNFPVVVFPMQMVVVINTFLTNKQSVVEGQTGGHRIPFAVGVFRYVILPVVFLPVQFWQGVMLHCPSLT